MTKAEIEAEARLVAVGIERDICDRRGLKSEYGQIDPEIQAEIIDDWTVIADRPMQRMFNAGVAAAVKACEKLEGDFGNEHGELCDCMTVVEDECNCFLSEFRKAVSALKIGDE